MVTTSHEPHLDENRTKQVRLPKDLPAPSGLPLIGNLHQVDIRALHKHLESWAAELGDTFRFRLGPKEIVVLSNPVVSAQVLRARPDSFIRMRPMEEVFAEVGLVGVFGSEGASWRTQRRLAVEALAQRHLRGFFPTLIEVLRRFQRRLARFAADGRVVDLQAELMRFTVDVTTRLAFDYDINTIEREGDILQQRLDRVFPMLFERLMSVVPVWRYFRRPSDRAFDAAIRDVNAFLLPLIAETRSRLDADPERAQNPQNFLEAMLAARDEDGQPFPDMIVLGNAWTMLLAGEDTTANTLAWCVHHLCDAPALATKLRAEVDPLGEPRMITEFSQLGALEFADAVSNEAMRLRPVAAFLAVEAIRDFTAGDLLLPVGTAVMIATSVQAKSEDSFSDPLRFDPDRWLSARLRHNPVAQMPFGSGPRICPGRTLAMLEMRLILAMLYKSFEFERVGKSSDVQEQLDFTMHPVGLRVKIKLRDLPRA